jgi:hypothetical protein
MQNRNVISKCIYLFGAGIALGFGAGITLRTTFPTTTEFAGLILQKLGLEFGDVLLLAWDPEANTRQTADVPTLELAALPVAKVVSTTKRKRKATASRRISKSPALNVGRRGNRAAAVAA